MRTQATLRFALVFAATVASLAVSEVLANYDDDADSLPSIYGMQSLALRCDTESKLRHVLAYRGQPGFDFLRVPRSPLESVDLLVTAERVADFKDRLRANDIEFSVEHDDVAKIVDQLALEQERAEPWTMMQQQPQQQSHPRSRRDVGLFHKFPRYDEIELYLRHLKALHNDTMDLFSIGKSYEGRDIWAVKISKSISARARKPIMLIDAGIHAREWIAPTTALYAVHQLVDKPHNSYIFDQMDVYVIPVLNPDGYEFTHYNRTTRLWRKTMSGMSKKICMGVDANRNFDYQWMSVGASPYACSSQYAGSRPFSEPETRALRDFILSRRGLIKVYLTLHSYGNYMLFPWGFTSELPPNEPVLRCAAELAESALARVRGTRYKIGSSTNVLYAAAGGSDDWAMGVAGVDLVYTIELPGGSYKFTPPTSEILPVGQETFEAIKVFARYVTGDICRGF
ncbi:carboxypeptidase B-like [Trichogramma pretiosum]|uniref:carboxypeptidase B-like n=1 Tax=Trichogramma pretiosum TaxID=7493 RepID=UPI0006C97C2E|nr:carboxypeptidase B-like [Trichogramma pretiosum]